MAKDISSDVAWGIIKAAIYVYLAYLLIKVVVFLFKLTIKMLKWSFRQIKKGMRWSFRQIRKGWTRLRERSRKAAEYEGTALPAVTYEQ